MNTPIRNILLQLFITVGLLVSLETAKAEVITVPGGKLLVDWQDDFTPREKNRIRQWLSYTAESASLITGNFPVEQTAIDIHKLSKGKGPVPWAHTVRGEQLEGIVFHVNPRKSLKKFNKDWTATHEFSHLHLPYVGRDDIWISEGFASYYQHILMMRKGTLTQQEGWQKIKDGLDRGAADPYQSGSLRETSKNMRQTRAFKRVYWSGAAYFLEIDLALREQNSSLDRVIEEFSRCCRMQDINWSGEKLANQLDIASNTKLFSQKFVEFEQRIGFPVYQSSLRKLGITYEGKKIAFTEEREPQILRRRVSEPQ